MFIGHFAVGVAAKRLAPRTPLALLLVAPFLLDMLWPVFVLLGWERVRIDPGNTAFTPLAFDHYPISHSLVTAVGWGAALGLIYWTRTRDRVGTVVLGLGVVSHWVLDAVTHRPDLPLYPGPSPLVGLGLWNSVAGTVLVEGALFVAGVWVYSRATRARDGTGRYAWWGLVALLAALYAASVASPPPPSVRAVALTGLVAAGVFPVWAAWIDRHRDFTGARRPSAP